MKTNHDLFFYNCGIFLDEYLPCNLRRSLNTITAYRTALNIFRQYALESGYGIDELKFKHITEDFMLDFRTWLIEDRQVKAQTANHRFSLVRKYMSYCGKFDATIGILSLKLQDITILRTEKSFEEAMTRDHLVKLIEHIPNTIKGIRNKMIIILLYETAERVNELLTLKMENLHIEGEANPYIIVHGKGNKERRIPLSENTCRNLKVYLQYYHQDLHEYLFYNAIKGKESILSHDCVEAFLRKYSNELKASYDPEFPALHSHLFRKSKATHMNEDGTSLMTISRFLGHESPTTTMVYVRPNYSEIRKAIEATESNNNSLTMLEKMEYERIKAKMMGLY